MVVLCFLCFMFFKTKTNIALVIDGVWMLLMCCSVSKKTNKGNMALGIEGPPASYKQIKVQCPSDYFASPPPQRGFCLFHLDPCVECPSLSRFRLGMIFLDGGIAES